MTRRTQWWYTIELTGIFVLVSLTLLGEPWAWVLMPLLWITPALILRPWRPW